MQVERAQQEAAAARDKAEARWNEVSRLQSVLCPAQAPAAGCDPCALGAGATEVSRVGLPA